LSIEPGQMRTQTEMDATTKRTMSGLVAGDIKIIRITEHRRVAIASDQYSHHPVIFRNDNSAKLGVFVQGTNGKWY